MNNSFTTQLIGLYSEGVSSKTNKPYKYLSIQTESGEEVTRSFISPMAARGLGIKLHEQIDLTGTLVTGVSAKGNPYKCVSVRTADGSSELTRIFLSDVELKGLFGVEAGENIALD